MKRANSKDNSREFQSHFASLLGAERWARLRDILMQPSNLVSVANSFAASTSSSDADMVPWLNSQPLTVHARQPSIPLDQPYQPPVTSSNGLKENYWMDAASLLPVLLLDLKPGQRVLDMCSAPGGKAFVIAQFLFSSTLDTASLTSSLTVNEPDKSRRLRLEGVLREYLPPSLLGTDRVKVQHQDADKFWARQEEECYDRVLIDAPCSSDRHHLQQSVANRGLIPSSAWSLKGNVKAMAQLQLQLLLAGLKTLKVGGRLCYSTCSMSDVENDEVVDKALKRINMRDDVVSVSRPEIDFKEKLGYERTKHGLLILPDVKEWGPIYCCVITKNRPIKPLASIATLLDVPDDEEDDGAEEAKQTKADA
jgi:16S rRNA C967 or C1407 C5-methylase (RsmB/RsmF family)